MPSSNSLLPREHGAYAEVGFPIITGLALGRPTLAAVAFALAVTFGFLLNEPIAILTGTRGNRLRQLLAVRARRRALVLALGLGAAGLFAMIAAPREARLAALVPGALAALLIPAALGGRLKAMQAELVVAAAFATSLLPIAISSGVTTSLASTASAVWFSTFTLGTLTVHAIKASIKPDSEPQWPRRAAPVLSAVVILMGVALAFSATVPRLAALAFLPAAVVTLGIGLMDIHPRRLRTIGWSMVGANLFTIVLLLVV